MAELFSRTGDSQFNEVTIEVSNLSISRGSSPLFSGLSAQISNRDILWIQGDNGIGKTTLLGALAGLHALDEGHISWTLSKAPSEPGKLIAYQPHQSYAKASLTAREDLEFWAKFYRSRLSIDAALDDVGLTLKADLKTGKLSAGQKRRLALAKLLISHKPVWLMDEPGAAMDKAGTDLIDKLLKRHTDNRGAAIIASHGDARAITGHSRLLTLRAVE